MRIGPGVPVGVRRISPGNSDISRWLSMIDAFSSTRSAEGDMELMPGLATKEFRQRDSAVP